MRGLVVYLLSFPVSDHIWPPSNTGSSHSSIPGGGLATFQETSTTPSNLLHEVQWSEVWEGGGGGGGGWGWSASSIFYILVGMTLMCSYIATLLPQFHGHVHEWFSIYTPITYTYKLIHMPEYAIYIILLTM